MVLTNRQKRVLVTGGLGFIGRTLLRSLQDDPQVEFIYVVDNLCNSSLTPDVRDEKTILEICNVSEFHKSISFTHIYHLASPVGPAGVLKYAGKMAQMIVSDTMQMAELALCYGAKLIDISTSEVYGRDPGDKSQQEDIDKVVPAKYTVRLEYGVAKLATEISLLNLARISGLQVNIIRPFNIVGVGQKGEVGFVLPRFVEAALVNRDLEIFGTGDQKRCFTSVKDIVQAILLIVELETYGNIFNVGNPANVISIRQLADCVIQLSGSSSQCKLVDPKTIFGPLYEEAWNKIPDISHIQKVVGWQPKYSLIDIVLEVLESYRDTNGL
jgi:nucleoside-diphosphate-sugar epimerase